MGFSLTIMALLARLRVLVQQVSFQLCNVFHIGILWTLFDLSLCGLGHMVCKLTPHSWISRWLLWEVGHHINDSDMKIYAKVICCFNKKLKSILLSKHQERKLIILCFKNM